jgi:hypothetical protein
MPSISSWTHLISSEKRVTVTGCSFESADSRSVKCRAPNYTGSIYIDSKTPRLTCAQRPRDNGKAMGWPRTKPQRAPLRNRSIAALPGCGSRQRAAEAEALVMLSPDRIRGRAACANMGRMHRAAAQGASRAPRRVGKVPIKREQKGVESGRDRYKAISLSEPVDDGQNRSQ